ncbi:MAG: fructose 1,6-bisphosphatase [Methanoculleus sp. SDB]|nr:MAG: fructose 1,6-bisphosphatase [Methanoculleus sp. SDB]
MITLREYLDKTGAGEQLKDLIVLIARQAVPIRDAFLQNQSYATSINASGEQQAALDAWSDRHITKVLEASGLVAELASEEQPDIIRFPGARAEYAVVMDPLDGSSLIQVNLAVGTIVGIFEGGGVLQKGENLRAAMYMLYGPMTVLTLTVGEGVYIFALNGENEYILLSGLVEMPEGNLYGSGGLKTEWTDAHAFCIDRIEQEGAKLRYSGSFVADFHQILKYGGVYCYPALKEKENGKLRLLFEAIPIGFIAAQAGGAISTGNTNLLAIQPSSVHQRTPLYVGSKGLIRRMEEFLAG